MSEVGKSGIVTWRAVGFIVLAVFLIGLLGGLLYYSGQTETLRSRVETLQSELTTLQSERAALQFELSTLQLELSTLQSERTVLQSELVTLQSRVEVLQSELTAVQEVYPPRFFSDYNELEEWVDEHYQLISGTGTHAEQLNFQRMALSDGYIWSVGVNRDTGRVVSVVVAGDSIYWVWVDGFIEWINWK